VKLRSLPQHTLRIWTKLRSFGRGTLRNSRHCYCGVSSGLPRPLLPSFVSKSSAIVLSQCPELPRYFCYSSRNIDTVPVSVAIPRATTKFSARGVKNFVGATEREMREEVPNLNKIRPSGIATLAGRGLYHDDLCGREAVEISDGARGRVGPDILYVDYIAHVEFRDLFVHGERIEGVACRAGQRA